MVGQVDSFYIAVFDVIFIRIINKCMKVPSGFLCRIGLVFKLEEKISENNLIIYERLGLHISRLFNKQELTWGPTQLIGE